MTTITTILGKCSFILINIEDYQMLITCISKKKEKKEAFLTGPQKILSKVYSLSGSG